ncbi:MAG: XdhC family protein [Bauldia sp.]|uniref:XdhC family protein n=1 Tax=Bauldia sp. TaxID=2575872 RepID=UPI001DC506D9|nr:XdhC family protein [Bauldia sp.]MCB1496620.1 XdhC family protein [Bauldia sp.]
MKLETLKRLNTARDAREAAILITDVTTGDERLVLEKDGYAGDPLEEELGKRFRSGGSGMVRQPEGGDLFFTVSVPPPRLVVVGAVHISQALAPMARIAGFDMSIVDPRTAFASEERFPDVPLYAEWPDVAIPKVGLDRFTALAALTHDPKIDDGALTAALAAGCFYVGALGSRKTHGKRLERLRAAGVDDAALETIHAPIGLAIGARSPAEIAVAILAEVIGALRRRGMAGETVA